MTSIAKITAPSPHGIVPRRKLFRALARRGHLPITWIVGPPGAGKTSLAAGYLQQSAGSSLWYQADAGDGDPATLFAYLRLAVQRVSRRRVELPVLDPGIGQDLLIFTRRFFEALFAALPPGSTLVLDNYQEIPADSPAHEVVRTGLEVLPAGVQVLVLSRQQPPAVFSRLRLDGRLAFITWETLRLDPRESEALIRARAPRGFTRAQIAELYRITDGWPAGLVLLAAGGVESTAGSPTGRVLDREALFDYFASEVLDRADPELRTMLPQLAVFPRCTAAQAVALCGLPAAGTRLRKLARTGYLTVEHGRDHPVYEFHPLFREFLRQRASATYPAEEWARLRSRAAELLDASGQIAESMELYRELGDVRRQVTCIRAHARAMLGQGQHRTLQAWIESLPPECLSENGWLLLWLGLCWMSQDLATSRSHLERAFARLVQEGDLTGQVMSCGAVMDTWLYAWDDYAPLDPWIDWLDQRAAELDRLPIPEVAEAVTGTMARALCMRQPDHPRMVWWAEQAERVLRDGHDLRSRLNAGATAILYRFWTGQSSAAEALWNVMQQITGAARNEPLAVMTSRWTEVIFHFACAVEPRRCRETVESALATGERCGVHLLDSMILGQGALAAILVGDRHGARQHLAAMERASRGHNSLGYFHFLSSWVRYLGGDLAGATVDARRGLELSNISGAPFSPALDGLALAELLFEGGRRVEAAAQAEQARAIAARIRWTPLMVSYFLGQARWALADPALRDRSRALEHLRQAMELMRTTGLVNFYWWVPHWLSQLCALALEEGIETEFVRRLIRLHRLVPPGGLDAPPNWPWELHVTTLGRFALRRDGEEVLFPTRSPRKVLLLLKALVAAGRRGIREGTLADRLWPGADGDTAQQALTTGLHRLRKLLGVDGAVIRREGRLVLNPACCWVDAHAFESLLDSSADGEYPPEEKLRRLERALALYTGSFLKDLEEPWAVAYRRQLADRFVDGIAVLGQKREQDSDLDEATRCYRRGLELEPGAALLQQRLSACSASSSQSGNAAANEPRR